MRCQAVHRRTIGFVCAVESNPQLHAHLALFAAGPLNYAFIERLWLEAIGSRDSQFAQAQPYELGRSGIAYIVKTIGTEWDEIELSSNFTDFARRDPSSSHLGNARQQRRYKRIALQIEHLSIGEGFLSPR